MDCRLARLSLASALLVGSAGCEPTPSPTAELRKVMYQFESGVLRMEGALHNGTEPGALVEDGRRLRGLFDLEVFEPYARKPTMRAKADEFHELRGSAVEAADALVETLSDESADPQRARAAVSALRQRCDACHTAFRVVY